MCSAIQYPHGLCTTPFTMLAGSELGPAVLFFGCRKKSHDFIYEQELTLWSKNGCLTELHLAFSRDSQLKDYVQHHMLKQAAAVWDLLSEQKGGYLYVCGDAKHMAKDVHKALHDIVQQVEGVNAQEAEQKVKQLTDSGRYQRDVW